MTASKEMETSVLQLQEINEFGTDFFPEPPDENPADPHLDFGLMTL